MKFLPLGVEHQHYNMLLFSVLDKVTHSHIQGTWHCTSLVMGVVVVTVVHVHGVLSRLRLVVVVVVSIVAVVAVAVGVVVVVIFGVFVVGVVGIGVICVVVAFVVVVVVVDHGVGVVSVGVVVVVGVEDDVSYIYIYKFVLSLRNPRWLFYLHETMLVNKHRAPVEVIRVHPGGAVQQQQWPVKLSRPA